MMRAILASKATGIELGDQDGSVEQWRLHDQGRRRRQGDEADQHAQPAARFDNPDLRLVQLDDIPFREGHETQCLKQIRAGSGGNELQRRSEGGLNSARGAGS